MSTARVEREATLEDLYRVEGKAELVDGRIVHMSPTGFRPNRSALRIWRSLDDYEAAVGGGYAVGDNAAFVLHIPKLRTFSPDAAWWKGTPRDADFLSGAPVFAAEVRSESDYGPTAERAMALKRAAYFGGGTLVVWDVDVLREGLVRVYRADDPEQPTIHRRGETADAEPAVPGWRMPVDQLFR
jgi:Uma2 family endonuclease